MAATVAVKVRIQLGLEEVGEEGQAEDAEEGELDQHEQ